MNKVMWSLHLFSESGLLNTTPQSIANFRVYFSMPEVTIVF